MRKMVTALLLAGTLAAPLLAQDRPDGDHPNRDQRRAAHADNPNNSSPQSQRPDRGPPQPQRPDRGPDQVRPDRGQPGPNVSRDPVRGPDRGPAYRPDRDPTRGPVVRPDRNPPRGDDRDSLTGRPGDRDGWRDSRPGDRDNWRPNNGYRGPISRGPSGNWSRSWRTDRRYNWQSWRSTNRYLFRGPRWYAPRGAYYRRFNVGYRFDPIFYGSRYWIADPWAYRLPPAYGPYRWVRYYNDVALVDLRSGQIVDIIYSFFY